MVAGTHSGSGKTTISLGLMAALKKKGLVVQPFKCGPDFIDPSLHKAVTGQISRNLDLWMCGKKFVRNSFAYHSRLADISLIEGVMGMFDGGDSSSAALARELNVPVVLVLDVHSMAESAAAVLKGFETMEVKVAPQAVILNKVGSNRHLKLLCKAIEEHCQSEIIGHLPRELDFSMPSRHLGLYMGDEHPITSDKLQMLGDTITKHVDLERIISLDKTSDRLPCYKIKKQSPTSVRIGIARDQAFCFYYEDNLDLLEKEGAELVFFSPLNDACPPEGLDGIYIGGGYPELYSTELSANKSMRAALKKMAQEGKIIYAECGGFMYLSKGICNLDGKFFPMCEVFPVRSKMNNKRSALGYREVVLKRAGFFGPAGTELRGHEFHYSHIEDMDLGIERFYETHGSDGAAGYRYRNVLAGYVHLHFGYTPSAAQTFITMCEKNHDHKNS